MAKLSRYFETFRDQAGQERMRVFLDGAALLRLPATNKGTAFTDEERVALHLDGLLPPHVSTLDEQLVRAYAAYQREPTPIAKYQFLRALQERNELLFFALLDQHLAEMLPIVYTPTVGDAVKQFSALFESARGLSLSPNNIDRAANAASNCLYDDVRMIVATDSSAILGIGDQGYGGIGISIGKLAIYTAGGGVSPYRSLPVGLDVGTDRADLLADPSYLGVVQKRLKGDAYLAFMDRFVDAIHARYPRAIVQWEDLSKDAAFTVLERYRKRIASFNDDIQGTGAVALAGVISACKLRGEALRDQRIIVYGAGAGGCGVAWALKEGLRRAGLSEREASARLFVLDSRGLLVQGRSMEDYKHVYAKTSAEISGWGAGAAPSLLDTIRHAKATVLLGLSGQPGTFAQEHVSAMATNTARPIVFPLSNPTSACEATPADILAWTSGAAIVATGSPFDPVDVGGKSIAVGQGNNAFIFPGLGFGSVLANVHEVTDGMVMAASTALADYTAEKHLSRGLIYPPIEELQEVSIRVTVRVIAQAFADGVATTTKLTPDDAETFVRAHFWRPRYLPLVRG